MAQQVLRIRHDSERTHVGQLQCQPVCTSTNPFFGPDFTALTVAHELGQYSGANHTHFKLMSLPALRWSLRTLSTSANGEGAAFMDLLQRFRSHAQPVVPELRQARS